MINIFFIKQHAVEAAIQMYKHELKREVRVTVLSSYLNPEM